VTAVEVVRTGGSDLEPAGRVELHGIDGRVVGCEDAGNALSNREQRPLVSARRGNLPDHGRKRLMVTPAHRFTFCKLATPEPSQAAE
jgi:hypothetical protein